MTSSGRTAAPQLKFHPDAYQFVNTALQFTQRELSGIRGEDAEIEGTHISGPELLEGIRKLAIQDYGYLTVSVFKYWGVTSSLDFGRIVFDFIERGVMKKTDSDQLSDFENVYDFQDVFVNNYDVDVDAAFN